MNSINRAGRVESEAKRYELPFPVLVGRGSDIVKDYKLKALPRLVIVDFDGNVAFYDLYAEADEISEILDSILEKRKKE